MNGDQADGALDSWQRPWPPPPPQPVDSSSRRWVRNGLIGFGVLIGAVLVICVVFPPWGWFEDPWRAKVISVEGDRVCTTPDRGEKDPGWADPLCFEGGLSTRDEDPVAVVVGQCVELESFHPAIVVNRIVPCA